jgi:hypothetical protein
MKNEYAATPTSWSNTMNNPNKKNENDEDIEMKPRKIDVDESDDELGEGGQEGDSNAEDETDNEMGEKRAG